MMRTIIVDDHPFFRKTLREFLDALDFVEVVGEAGDGEEAIAAAERLRPRLIVMDVQMPRLDGITACARLQQKAPAIRVALYSMDGPGSFAGKHAPGAGACLSKDHLFEDLPHIIEQLSRPSQTA